MKKPANSFSVIELMVVMFIIALLSGMAFVVYQHAAEARERVRCLNSLRQWSIALAMYANEHGDLYPPSGELFNRTPEVSAFMSNYLGLADSGSYSASHLPLAMCKSGVATFQNNTAFVGWSVFAGFSGPAALINDYAGVNFTNDISARQSGLAYISCVTATDAASNNWTGHGVTYDPASTRRPQGQTAAWPDGHARWVNFDDLRVAVIKIPFPGVTYHYLMPKQEL